MRGGTSLTYPISGDNGRHSSRPYAATPQAPVRAQRWPQARPAQQGITPSHRSSYSRPRTGPARPGAVRASPARLGPLSPAWYVPAWSVRQAASKTSLRLRTSCTSDVRRNCPYAWVAYAPRAIRLRGDGERQGDLTLPFWQILGALGSPDFPGSWMS